MATIVKHNTTGKITAYLVQVLVFFSLQNRTSFLGNLLADVDEGQYAMVCVCDSTGKIFWIDADDVTVVSVDGQNVGELPLT